MTGGGSSEESGPVGAAATERPRQETPEAHTHKSCRLQILPDF